jgi:hypothetical protein
MTRLGCCGFVCALLATLGCGGVDQTSLLGDGGSGGPDASAQDVATTMDSSIMKDSATIDSLPPMDVVTVDVPVGPPDSLIQCGPSTTCSAQTQLCCHHTNTVPEWQCVTDVSACSNAGDVPIGCSGTSNCVSQGNPTYICCADLVDDGTCGVASDVSCMAACDPTMGQTQVGCSTTDPCQSTQTPVCKASTCTLPGYNICEP